MNKKQRTQQRQAKRSLSRRRKAKKHRSYKLTKPKSWAKIKTNRMRSGHLFKFFAKLLGVNKNDAD